MNKLNRHKSPAGRWTFPVNNRRIVLTASRIDRSVSFRSRRPNRCSGADWPQISGNAGNLGGTYHRSTRLHQAHLHRSKNSRFIPGWIGRPWVEIGAEPGTKLTGIQLIASEVVVPFDPGTQRPREEEERQGPACRGLAGSAWCPRA